jgi:hypothetical protein
VQGLPVTTPEVIKYLKNGSIHPSAKPGALEPAVYKQAVDEYTADVKANPDGYKDMLSYKGE